jgi:hypothetical protein
VEVSDLEHSNQSKEHCEEEQSERAANAAGRPTDAAIREGEQAEDEDMFVTDPDEGEGPDNPMVEE